MAKIVFLLFNPVAELQDKEITLEDSSPVRIGRCHATECVLQNNGLFPSFMVYISCHHADIYYSNEQFYIEDKSQNGTYINGCRINSDEKMLLTSGDVLQLGEETFSSTGAVLGIQVLLKLFRLGDINLEQYNAICRDYDNTLSMIYGPPNFEISLEQLHTCVRERFQVLQILDEIGSFSFYEEYKFIEIIKLMKKESTENMLKLITGGSVSFEEEYFLRRMDHVSHYIVCLSCCQNYVLRKWFRDQEIKLLHLKWHFLGNHEKHKFITKYYSHIEKVNVDRNKKYSTVSQHYIPRYVDYYKIHFSQVSELVKDRKVTLINGYCFVPFNKMIFAISTDGVKRMKRNSEFMKQNLHKIWYDERITSIINYISKEIHIERFLFDKGGSTVLLTDIDKLAEESFPLCMKLLHNKLKQKCHLKNGGRFQYGLFLKAIGLSLQDSLTFWRYYFTRKMPLDEFVKNYQYHIKHSYGAVGKMANYPPQSCKTILQVVPTFGEYHGCPFKLLKEEEMTPLLSRLNFSDTGKRDIIDLMKNGTPQLACKKYFELSHGVALNETPYHPNKYFEESRNLRQENLTESMPCQLNKKYSW